MRCGSQYSDLRGLGVNQCYMISSLAASNLLEGTSGVENEECW